ncbi:MAG TPA: cobalt ECF transporter T component CbiQ [Terriglobia bacterium]|nr:cobalt ECF transporter T component CbiQ [Terriglobia bacterium]
MNFVERTLSNLINAMEHALYAEELAKSDGLLQRLDPRIKVVGILALVVASTMAHRLSVIGALFAVAVIMAVMSRVSLGILAKRAWIAILVFTAVIALPAPFITPGREVWRLPGVGWPVTAQGLASACYLVARVETAATLSVLLILCTPWTHVLKALRVLRVPVVFVVTLGMTYRYILLLLQTAHDMFESRQSRMVGRLEGTERRRVAAASTGVLMSKSLQLSGDVYNAMLSRGFRGEVYVLDDFQTSPLDWAMLAAFVVLALGGFYFGR